MLFSGKTVLVSGGAGYIGSHVVAQLLEEGSDVHVIDDLSQGRRDALPESVRLFVNDILDVDSVRTIIEDTKYDAFLHFAGKIVVSESVSNPEMYYLNNTVASFQLLELIKTKIPYFIFSSTAAVYGIPEGGVCTEDMALDPINPYGRSKLMTEMMLKDICHISPLKYVILRYFNVAGADVKKGLGQTSKQSTHLIKIASEVACNKRDKMMIFGDDYDTPDGTCIRDYIHVLDLANAHILSLNYLFEGGQSETFNCGYNRGSSVKEVIKMVRQVSGHDLPAPVEKRRDGDPPQLIADSSKIATLLSWVPEHDSLEEIVKNAYEFEASR